MQTGFKLVVIPIVLLLLFVVFNSVYLKSRDYWEDQAASAYYDGYNDGLSNGYDSGREYVDEAIASLQKTESLIRSTAEYGGDQKYEDICDDILDDVTDALAWLAKEP